MNSEAKLTGNTVPENTGGRKISRQRFIYYLLLALPALACLVMACGGGGGGGGSRPSHP